MRRRTKRYTTANLRKYTNGHGKGFSKSFKRAYKTSINGVKAHPYISASVSTLTLAGVAGLISGLILMKRH